jgi:hypothetical protein
MIELLVILIPIIITVVVYGTFLSLMLLVSTLIVFYLTNVTFSMIYILIVFIAIMIFKFKKS